MGTTDRPTRAMFIGTCRMHDPVKALRKTDGLMARGTPHRFHTPAQTLQFVQHLSGAPQYLPTTLHLMSDYATAQIFEAGVARETLMDNLATLQSMWPSFQVFVIEICSLREHMAAWNGRPLVVNTFANRDQGLHADKLAAAAAAGQSLPAVPIEIEKSNEALVHQRMRRIKAALGGRPVIWVSHQRPPSDSPEYATVNAVRLAAANVVQAAASRMGDPFVDPSHVAAEMGQKAFFLKDGTDLDHMTPEAATRLGALYHRMILDLAG